MTETLLHSIRLQNFKRHENLEVDFSETLTVICGPNYAGKSTVLEAVFFALFGTKAVPGGAEVITRHGSKSKACVTLSLRIAGEDYVVIRTPSTATLMREEETVATGHTAVNEVISEKVGGDMKRIMMLAFSSQGETSALLTMGAAKLNSIIEEVSGIDYVDQLIEKAMQRVIAADAVLDAMGEVEDTEVLEEAHSNAEAQLNENSGKEKKLAEKIVKQKKLVDDSKKTVERVQADNQAAERKNKKRQTLLASKDALKATIETKSDNLKEMPKPVVSDAEANLAKAQEALSQSEKNYEQLRNLQAALDKRTDWRDSTGDKYIDNSENIPKCESLRAKIADFEETRKGLVESESKSRNEVNRLRKDLKGSVCSACNRPFDESHADETRAKLEIEEFKLKQSEAALEANTEKLDEFKADLRKLERNLPPENWQELLQENAAQIEKLENEISEIEFDDTEHQALKAAEKKAQSEHANAVAQDRERSRLVKSLQDDHTSLAELQDELALNTEAVTTPLEPLLEDQGKQFEAYSALLEQRTALVAQIGADRAEEEALRLRLKKAVELAGKRAEAETAKARFSGFARWLRSNKATFLSDTWAGILALVSEFVSSVTSGRVEEIGRDEGGDFWYREDGRVMPILAASGGQKSIAGAGLRIALASLLPASLNFVVLDEPSADLNAEHAAALAGALRATNRQVILVTHREGEEFSSDAVVTLE